MSMINYKELVDKYEDYLKSSEALAVYLVKSYVHQVDTRNKWIDIVNSSTWEHRSSKTAFNYLIIEVFDRMKHPIYPKRTEQMDDYGFRQICKAITWEVSHDDIRDQQERGIRGQLFLAIIQIYNKNKGKKVVIEKPVWNDEYGGFDYTGKVPTSTKKSKKTWTLNGTTTLKLASKLRMRMFTELLNISIRTFCLGFMKSEIILLIGTLLIMNQTL